jgi:hypothetical protein
MSTDPSFISLNGTVLLGADSIDDAGQVLLGGGSVAGVYTISSGTYQNIPFPSSGYFGSIFLNPTAISNAGVVGYIEGPGFVNVNNKFVSANSGVSFLYNGNFSYFGGTGNPIDANAVNNGGQIVGSPDAPARHVGQAVAINDSGVVVGDYFTGANFAGFKQTGAVFETISAGFFKPTAAAPSSSTTTVINTDPAAPTISGTVAGQTTSSEAPVNPFSGVSISDPNSGATDTLTITLSANGTTGTLSGSGLSGSSSGVYTLAAASAATITSELQALKFTPTAGAPNSSTTTSFALSDLSSGDSTPTVNNKTTVINTDPAVASTTVTGINNNGDIVGYFTNTSNHSYGFVRSFPPSGEIDTLIAPPGSVDTYLTGINNSDEVVGYYIDSSGQKHAFVETGGNYATGTRGTDS